MPAEALDEFNRHIVGQIRVVSAYVGEKFEGALNAETLLPDEV